MMKLGSTTPAYHGSKNTSISCKPRKYHGAFDGLGVRVGFAGSSNGAFTSNDQTINRTRMKRAHRNSARTRCGQVCTLSSPGPCAFLMGTSSRLLAGAAPGRVARLPCASATVLLLGARLGRPEEQHQQEREDRREHEDPSTRDHHGDP